MFVVVNLTVVGEHQRPQHHRLMTRRGRILDGEPTETEGRARMGPNTLVVGTPMAQALRHELDCFAAGPRPDDTDYAAHGRQSSATPAFRNVPLAIGRRFV